MSKIKLDLRHSKNGTMPFGNETFIEPKEEECAQNVILSIQEAIKSLEPYVKNCPANSFTGRSVTYLTIAPIYEKKREEVIGRLDEIKTSYDYLINREQDFDGQIRLSLTMSSTI